MIDSRPIGTVLVTVSYPDAQMQRLRQAFAPALFLQCDPKDDTAIRKALETADVAVSADELDDRFYSAPRLKWVHCDHAGLDQAARPEILDSGLIITGSAGRSSTALAQHAFYFALALTYDTRRLLADQDNHVWRGIPGYGLKLGLPGKTLGIVGLGNTGMEMAKLGRAFGMTVIAYGRSAPSAAQLTSVDGFLCSDRGDTLAPLLDRADVIMLAAPLTDATRHMFSAPQFRRMKPSALIINMARGALIDEPALIAALEAGELAGAGLDVFETEPLPSDSPLWDAPNLLITPHVTPAQPDKIERSVDVIVANAANYRSGRPMVNRLTAKDVYSA